MESIKFDPTDERHCDLLDEAREVIAEQRKFQKDYDIGQEGTDEEKEQAEKEMGK